jgi:SAM-dependent methyltransferase
MRAFRHWTPRYIKNRLATIYYEKANPDQPWLTRSANEILNSYLIKSDIGLEFGSGRSTAWFARRISHLTSVEHDAAWAAKVQGILNKASINNVDYKLITQDKDEGQGNDSEYVKVIDDFDSNKLDFCLVDGLYREFCVLKVIEKLRPGGLLVIDNVNWYLPSGTYSPNSRSFTDGPNGPVWKEVEKLLTNWRRIWTSSGVTDTAIYFKPNN